MKQSVLNRTKALVTLGLSAGLLIGYPALMVGCSAVQGVENPLKETDEKATAKKSNAKVANSRSTNVIKVYPDMFRKSMHVVAKDIAVEEVDFYVFDLEGTLVKNFKMKEKDRQPLHGLAKGKYQYRVFAGDEEAANGQFEIR